MLPFFFVCFCALMVFLFWNNMEREKEMVIRCCAYEIETIWHSLYAQVEGDSVRVVLGASEIFLTFGEGKDSPLRSVNEHLTPKMFNDLQRLFERRGIYRVKYISNYCFTLTATAEAKAKRNSR